MQQIGKLHPSAVRRLKKTVVVVIHVAPLQNDGKKSGQVPLFFYFCGDKEQIHL